MSSEVIAIACDHAGFELKNELKQELKNLNLEVLDLGTNEAKSVDYPDYGYAMAAAIKDNKASRGILVCGSGIGISIAANRHNNIRAALVHDSLGAKMSRLHNDANVIVFGGRVIGKDVAVDCLHTFLNTDFESGRHKNRVEKLSNP